MNTVKTISFALLLCLTANVIAENHAILFSGGVDPDDNHTRYRGETTHHYNGCSRGVF